MASPVHTGFDDSYEIITELGFQNVLEYDMDDISYGLPQEMKYVTEKSPFHQSDSGVSEMSEVGYPNPKSVESSCSVSSPPAMLDTLVESLDFSPFGSNDNELEGYICGSEERSSGADGDLLRCLAKKSEEETFSTEESETEEFQCSLEKENKISTRRSTSASRNKNKFPSVVLKSSTNERSKSTEKPITVIEDCSPSGVKTVKILKVVKTPGSACSNETIAQVTTAIDSRNRKNAMNAKMNREKKKAYVQKLESSLDKFEKENLKLTNENKQLIADKKALEEQVDYFKSVLANQSTLSKVLNTMENLKGVKLSSSISISSRKRGLRSDHTYDEKRRKVGSESKSIPEFPPTSSGICLHVDDDMVSLEFCSQCSKMAKGAER